MSSQLSEEPLQLLPFERWVELEDAFKSDWPRGVPGLSLLKTQKLWKEKGIVYDVKVYCPFGKVENGMVAIHERFQAGHSYLIQTENLLCPYNRDDDKADSYAAVIQCPTDNTEPLETALKQTSIINWNREITMPCCSSNVMECLRKVIPEDDPNKRLIIHDDLNMYLMNRTTPFEDISTPPGISFGFVRLEDTELINSTWPHRYPNSEEYFKLLVKFKLGYALIKNEAPISWVFVNEVGMFVHTYTIETERKKGYAELLYKLVCNILMEEKRDMFGFVLKDNVNAQKLHEKVGFTKYHAIGWCFCIKKKKEAQ